MRSASSSVTNAGSWPSSGGARFHRSRTRQGEFLRAALCVLLLGRLPIFAAAQPDEIYADVVRQARLATTLPYRTNETSLPEVLRELNYDTYRMITFRREQGLWFGDRTRFQAQFFHPGYLHKEPVTINEVVNGEVHPVGFSPEFFCYPRFDPASLAGSKLGFAGFRLLYPLNHRNPVDEVISVLGASYFRALAAGQVYGISARGLAIDTAENMPEEFPAFREFWLCKPAPDARELQFFARLDSPSVSGAFSFVLRPGKETTLDVETHLFFRKSVQVLGLAPLTSMFWRDERNPRPPNDKRPEVHDSDTLVIENAANQSQTCPLQHVERVTTQLFPAKDPHGFGLLQSDRDAAHYLDPEANYGDRPSVFVESTGEWGEGAVRLMQLPATNEYHDNVVAFWQPQKVPVAGDELVFKYRLRWFTRDRIKTKRIASDETQS